jgi:hypothetical protein
MRSGATTGRRTRRRRRRGGPSLRTRCCLLGLLLALGGSRGREDEDNGPTGKLRVAVIGGGVGGAYFAMEASRLLGPDVSLTLFERDDRVGGRVQSFAYENRTLELGASIAYVGNANLRNAADALNLKRIPLAEQNVGFWDGANFVYLSSQSLWSTAAAVFRWGFLPLWRMHSRVNWAKDRFENIYSMQDSGVGFETGEELWDALGLLELAHESISQHLGSSALTDEFVYAANRVSYNQDSDEFNALAGLVSLIPAVTGNLFRIEGGNQLLVEAMLRSAPGLQIVTSTEVTSVREKMEGGVYKLFARQAPLGDFDAVVLAAPLGHARISFELGGKAAASPVKGQEFTVTHTTFVKGKLQPRYFGASEGDMTLPGSILLTRTGGAKEPFSSLGAQFESLSAQGEAVMIHKIFSSNALHTGQLDSMFGGGGWEIIHERMWQAYPELRPVIGDGKENATSRWPLVPFPGHQIHYLSGLEMAVSAMEISTIAARNAVNLLAKHLEHREEQRQDELEQYAEL